MKSDTEQLVSPSPRHPPFQDIQEVAKTAWKPEISLAEILGSECLGQLVFEEGIYCTVSSASCKSMKVEIEVPPGSLEFEIVTPVSSSVSLPQSLLGVSRVLFFVIAVSRNLMIEIFE